MLTLTTRPYLGEQDLQAIADFLNNCEVVDHLDEYYTLSELQLEFSDPSVDPVRDLRLWQSADETLIGFGQLWIAESGNPVDGYLWFRIHPKYRNQGLESEIFSWGEARMREVSRERHVDVVLRSSGRDHQRDRLAFLESAGFKRDRCFLSMARSLLEPIPTPEFPSGFTLRQVSGESEVQAWVEAYNQSFIDHWNYHPLSLKQRLHWMTDPHYQPMLDLVAIAPTGEVAAFCYCQIDQAFNLQKQRKEGWIATLGTRRGFRRIGLGRAMLLTGLHQLRLAGTDTAKLGVDTQNPNQAQTLYQSVGFRKRYASYSYSKDL